MIIIPARIASTRFPRKVLAEIDGVPMVVATARTVAKVDDVVVATDSREVAEVCEKEGIRTVMTSSEHLSGTDRINEAAARLGLDSDEIIVNVQADEPFIEPEVVETLVDLVRKHRKEERTMISSLYKTVSKEEAENPNLVKVVTDECGFALYFSRSPIPFDREGTLKSLKGHLGLYGFTRKMLEKFCALPHAPLEHVEKLEQLRALSHGYEIAMAEVETKSFGIDTPEDLERAMKMMRERG
ncbi:3-deoxy-manno-octulosonate cytidylyltransferase [Hydrogenimonas sp.]|jgi:3-deoxy-manno-octulosonate cytidylyltransferase (CMP-KDO synthetase)|uniref:3-deoxy-manno-octulosonate cytidylyltransferase n=1 Tax=Hydrogenimonas sp. TaxID=2231112 RepID=UPI00261361B6|nr:3-deoxy-manno-octulosonate cytidylyltransferase [Hydrogenimonas sp.]